MASSIEMVKIRATIQIGSFSVQTPFISSFNVTKTRGQISTFSASIKVKAGTSEFVGQNIVIIAGEENREEKIFTGLVKTATISPCFDDPEYVLVNLSGKDILSELEGKKFTRRCKASKATWVTIDGVSRKGLKSGKFKARAAKASFHVVDAEIEEDPQLAKAIGISDTGPWDKPKNAPENKQLGVVKPEITFLTE